ncbi:MAG: helix-turn-helix transcriptional regulator [Gemmatimonadota bacterium]|jgi:predicted XRE-type DNA-binding protein
MRDDRRKVLEASGWKVGTAEEFLNLTGAEVALVEMKMALSDGLRALRVQRHLTQAEVAEAIGSSQSRVAKMEAADPSVSMDLLVRTLLRLGATPEIVASLVSGDWRGVGAWLGV